MKLTTLFISLILTITSVGQNLTELKQHLFDKSLVAIKQMVNALPSTYTSTNKPYTLIGKWIIQRDITPDFQEAVVELEDSYAIESEKGSRRVSDYKLYLIGTSSEIIFYRLVKKHSIRPNKERNTWDFEWEQVDSFLNQKMFDKFELSFKSNYKIPLNKKDLLNDDKVFGFSCGYSGKAPELLPQLLEILDQKNYKEIDKWLCSANVEKQMYAIFGLDSLNRRGRKLTDEQQRLINLIKNKGGKVNVCRGCSYSKDSVDFIVTQILSGRGV